MSLLGLTALTSAITAPFIIVVLIIIHTNKSIGIERLRFYSLKKEVYSKLDSLVYDLIYFYADATYPVIASKPASLNYAIAFNYWSNIDNKILEFETEITKLSNFLPPSVVQSLEGFVKELKEKETRRDLSIENLNLKIHRSYEWAATLLTQLKTDLHQTKLLG